MSKTQEKISKIVDVLNFLLIFHSFDIAFILLRAGIPRSHVDYSRKNDIIRIKGIGMNLKRKEHLFFIRGIEYANRLINGCNAAFQLDDNERILVNIDGIEAFISTERDLDLINSIFVGYKYNIIIDRPTVVLDVGMNVGFSALFFAKNPNVIVVGFEPFEMTFNQASSNIKLNNNFTDRIITHQYGLAGINKRIRAEYSFELNRFASIYGFPGSFSDTNYDTEEIEIRNASEIVKDIGLKFPNRDIVMKIDCEGSEYEIINSLYENEELANIHCILMKWHIRDPTNDPDKLVSQLKASGFAVIKTRSSRDGGSLYAFRTICNRF
jgi:FkbM family methyltransferase